MARFDQMPAGVKDATAPSGTLRALEYEYDAGAQADKPILLTGWWTISSSPTAALGAAKALLPQWASPHPTELSSEGVTVTGYEESLQTNGILAAQDVTAQIAPLGGGKRVLRVDVQIEWRRPRTAAEILPRYGYLAVTESVVRTFGTEPVKYQATTRDASTIAAITGLINDLPNSEAEPPVNCPAEPAAGTTLTLVFRDSATSPVRATVVVPDSYGQCGGWVRETLSSSDPAGYAFDGSAVKPPLNAQIARLTGINQPVTRS